MPPRPSRSPSRRLLVAATLLCLGAELSGLAHALFVVHVACSAHGQFEHGVEAPRDFTSWAAVERVADGVGVSSAVDTHLEVDADDHCALLGSLRARLRPARTAALPPNTELEAGRGGAPRVVAFVVIPVLCVAPKGSPPALA